jgi:hypothetical protein
MNFNSHDRFQMIIWTLAAAGAGALILVMVWAAW